MTLFQCPICSNPLARQGQGFVCTGNHHFDTAKEGYVNLLPVQHKASKVPGDSKEMVMARRQFLAAGHFDFLRQALITTIETSLPSIGALLDSGCGEGYYTNAISHALPEVDVYGIDIAKAAVKYAAKRSDSVNYAVASSSRYPIKDACVDVVTKVFAPIDHNQALRILKPKGQLISVVPGPRHLWQLKQQIYDTPKEHQVEKVFERFELVNSEGLKQQVMLEQSDDIAALLQMTPFAWKLQSDSPLKDRLITTGHFDITFDFVINRYQVS